MSAYAGKLVLLQIKIGDDYQVVGGMRTTKFIVNNNVIDISNKSSGRWRSVLSGAGIVSAAISCTGVFSNSKSEHIVRELAFNSECRDFKLYFGNADQIKGKFMISSYERTGDYLGEEQYGLTLESSGQITYIPK